MEIFKLAFDISGVAKGSSAAPACVTSLFYTVPRVVILPAVYYVLSAVTAHVIHQRTSPLDHPSPPLPPTFFATKISPSCSLSPPTATTPFLQFSQGSPTVMIFACVLAVLCGSAYVLSVAQNDPPSWPTPPPPPRGPRPMICLKAGPRRRPPPEDEPNKSSDPPPPPPPPPPPTGTHAKGPDKSTRFIWAIILFIVIYVAVCLVALNRVFSGRWAALRRRRLVSIPTRNFSVKPVVTFEEVGEVEVKRTTEVAALVTSPSPAPSRTVQRVFPDPELHPIQSAATDQAIPQRHSTVHPPSGTLSGIQAGQLLLLLGVITAFAIRTSGHGDLDIDDISTPDLAVRDKEVAEESRSPVAFAGNGDPETEPGNIEDGHRSVTTRGGVAVGAKEEAIVDEDAAVGTEKVVIEREGSKGEVVREEAIGEAEEEAAEEEVAVQDATAEEAALVLDSVSLITDAPEPWIDQSATQESVIFEDSKSSFSISDIAFGGVSLIVDSQEPWLSSQESISVEESGLGLSISSLVVEVDGSLTADAQASTQDSIVIEEPELHYDVEDTLDFDDLLLDEYPRLLDVEPPEEFNSLDDESCYWAEELDGPSPLHHQFGTPIILITRPSLESIHKLITFDILPVDINAHVRGNNPLLVVTPPPPLNINTTLEFDHQPSERVVTYEDANVEGKQEISSDPPTQESATTEELEDHYDTEDTLDLDDLLLDEYPRLLDVEPPEEFNSLDDESCYWGEELDGPPPLHHQFGTPIILVTRPSLELIDKLITFDILPVDINGHISGNNPLLIVTPPLNTNTTVDPN